MATMPPGFGLLPSAALQPYGSEILKAGIGQLGTPIDVGAVTPKVAGQTAFQQKGPFWSRHYRFFRQERELTVIREVFSPQLEKCLGPTPRQKLKMRK